MDKILIDAMKVFACPSDRMRDLSELWAAAKIMRDWLESHESSIVLTPEEWKKSLEDAYRSGYAVGYEAGYNNANDEGMERYEASKR